MKDESGQTLVITAVSLVLLMSFLAFAIDVGLLFRARRQMQIAADAAAMAGASQLYYGPASTYKSVAIAAAKANGVDASVAGNTVNVGPPVATDPNAGCPTCVEAQVGGPAQTFFAGLFTGGHFVTVAAKAVAGAPSAGSSCIWIMKPSSSDVLHLLGSSTINAPGCSIYVNSSDSSAVKVTGNSNSFNGPQFNVVGNYTGHNTSPTGISTGVAPQTPPISNLTDPTCTVNDSSTTISAAYTPSGGANAGTIVCFTNAVTLNNGAALAGALGNGIVYEFQQGVTVATGATVSFGQYTGTPPGPGQAYDPTKTYGAVMDLSGGTLNQNSNSILNAYAPTSGTFNAVAIMQPATNPTTPLQVQFGSNGQTLDGIIYAPGTQVYLQDNGGGVTATGIIASTMYLKSSSITIPNYSNVNPTTTPFRQLTMME